MINERSRRAFQNISVKGKHKQWVCDEREQRKFEEVEGMCIYSTIRLGLERSLENKIWKENGGRLDNIMSSFWKQMWMGDKENSKMFTSFWLLCGTWAFGGCGHCVVQERGDRRLNLYKTHGKSLQATYHRFFCIFFSV